MLLNIESQDYLNIPSKPIAWPPFRIVFAIAGLYAEQNILIFKVLASFLAGILKLMHHMVNLSNESGQA